MAIMYCHQCKAKYKCKNVESARAAARLHMAFVGCVPVFGYSDDDFKKMNIEE